MESATWMEIEGRVTLHQELAFLAEKDSASKSILRIIEMYGKKTFSDKFLTDYIAATRSTLLRSSCDIPVVVNPVVSRAVTPLVVAKQPQPDVQAPQWDDDGEVIPTSEPVAAVSVVEYDPSGKTTGQTFPEGSHWLPIKAPASSEALEEHTVGLSEVEPSLENADLVKYVAARSSHDAPTPNTVLINAVIKPVIEEASVETLNGRIDGDNCQDEKEGFISLNVSNELQTQKTEENDEEPKCVLAPAIEDSTPKTPYLHQKRKRSIRLSSEERQAGVLLGIVKPTPTRAKVKSVLDNYERIQGRKKPAGTRQVKQNVLIRRAFEQDNKCKYCDREFGSLCLIDGDLVTLKAEPDHFVPRAERSSNAQSNIVAACQICNRLKTSYHFDSIEEARDVLQTAWVERDWKTAPRFMPFKRELILCNN